jgi:hypothetical protein
MKLIEATAGGVVAAFVAVLLASKAHTGHLFEVGAVAFGVLFLAVLLRPDRSFSMGKR